jgi:hypothetical protein
MENSLKSGQLPGIRWFESHLSGSLVGGDHRSEVDDMGKSALIALQSAPWKTMERKTLSVDSLLFMLTCRGGG